jgi:hypothetical protein
MELAQCCAGFETKAIFSEIFRGHRENARLRPSERNYLRMPSFPITVL